MGELGFRDGLMEQIRLRETRFDERAFLFVLASREFLQSRLPERRHVDGRELAHAVRELALERFGVMSRLVLEHWGIRSTAHLGDIVFAEVPEAGKRLAKGQEAAVVESVKAASDVYSPVSGEVTEGNQAVADDPALINRDPEGEGWFFKLKLDNPGEVEGLMDEAAYREWAATH